MKKSFALIMAFLICLTSLGGCSSGGGETVYLDTFKTTFSDSIASLNPFVLEGTTYYEYIANLFDGLIETDRYGRYAPALAESWSSNDDMSVWTFKLRQGQYWVDSTGAKTEYEITAQSFVDAMRYVADPMTSASNFSTIRSVITGLEDYYYDLIDIDEGVVTDVAREDVVAQFESRVGVVAVDDYTLEYHLSGPTPYFLSYLTLEMFLPLEQDFLDSVGEDFGTAKENLLYCGSYYLSTWDRDKMIIMTQNEHYWDKENVTLKSIQLERVSDSVSNVELFQRGDIDEVSLSNVDTLNSVRGTDYEKYIYLKDKGVGSMWFYYNFASPNPEFDAAIDNLNFRKALYYAFDRVTLSAMWQPTNPEEFTRYTLLPENAMFDEDGVDYTDYPALKPYKETNPFQPEEAQKYMQAAIEELCEADGVTLKGVTPTSVDRLPITEFDVDGKLPIDILYTSGNSENEMKKSLLVKEMLETYLGKENVNIILGYSNNSFSDEVWALGNWDLVDDSFGFRYGDPSANLNRMTTDYDICDSQYSVPEFDAMVEDAANTFETKERYTKYSEAEAWMLDNAYIVPYVTTGGVFRMTRLVPYTTPQSAFGMSGYKYKGALVQETPVTTEQHEQLRQAHEQEISQLTQ